MIDHHLLRKINDGRCFVLVGSGPSCEVGYPSWERLAKLTYEALLKKGLGIDESSYKVYLTKRKYPELFRQAELDLGDRQQLVDLLKSFMIPENTAHGFIYDILSRWPFACYLTTNFDNELADYLNQTGQFFKILRNRVEDFSVVRDGATNIIQKLHSDLDHPDEAVITSADYSKYYAGDSGNYFRVKLRQIFEMFDILIVGHSLYDPDISYVLELARNSNNITHPIYMIASNFTMAEEREYLDKYNIVLLSYKDTDGNHAQLRKLLSIADRFIVPRGQLRLSSQHLVHEEIEAASSLFIFTRLQPARSANTIIPLVLTALSTVQQAGASIGDLSTLPPLRSLATAGDTLLQTVRENVDILVQDGLAKKMSDLYCITDAGLDKVREMKSVRDTEKDQAYGQFVIDLRKNFSDLTSEQEQSCTGAAEAAIVSAFASRGLMIANRVFAGQSASSEELSDVFESISRAAVSLEGFGLQSAFVDSMYQFVVSPNDPQKRYLASISQGYFLYHLLGLDPTCHRIRSQIFKDTPWFLDSSVFLPLSAVGCNNHDYAVEFFAALHRVQAAIYTTPNLLVEAWNHFEWALNFVKFNGIESPEFLRAALVKGSYNQNLFLDGYIRLSAEGRIGTFRDYLNLISPKGIDRDSFYDSFRQYGIQVIKPSNLSGFVQEDWGEIEDIKAQIKELREARGTYRSELQVESEAEVFLIVKHLRSGKYSLPNITGSLDKCYFVSPSRILDRVFYSSSGTITTWTPEAVYRYMSTLPDNHMDPELLQQCMLHEYFYAGVSLIDKERYLRFFGPSIDAAKAAYKAEKDKYIAETEQIHVKDLDDAFDKMPDLEKPFFMAQMGWKFASIKERKAETESRRAAEAESKVKQLEAEKANAWRNRSKETQKQEKARLRNLQDPKHLHKRQKQAKKRRGKKK